MPLFPASFVEDLKSHADIVQVVQERVQLRRSGATHKGLCPFHGEKTPSFHVYGDKGFFKCFGCGVGGDVIKFVELYDKVSFPEAVRQLAARVGLTVPEQEDARQDVENQRERESLLKVHEIAAAWFREQLHMPHGGAARRLLAERGVTSSTADQLCMGYAPPARDHLRARLLKEGFPPELLVKSGLVIDRVDLANTGNNAVLIENCYNVNLAAQSGTVTGGGEIRLAARSEFPNNSDITVQNLTVNNSSVRESPCGTNTTFRNLKLNNSTSNVCP